MAHNADVRADTGIADAGIADADIADANIADAGIVDADIADAGISPDREDAPKNALEDGSGQDLEQRVWLPPTADCYGTLGPTTLDLWRIPLDRPVQTDTLSDDEVARFKRYRFAADQRKFAVARSSLRQILAHYSHQSPASLAFDYGVRGKPQLRHHGWLQFNLSHSGEYALCGVARQVVGVDIEQLRFMDRLDGLIRRCLAMAEQRIIEQVAPDHQSTVFLKYWTCKEAYLKATGQGISESLAAIEVELSPTPRLQVPESGADQPWQLQVLVPCDGYTAAVVMPPGVTQIRLWAYETI